MIYFDNSATSGVKPQIVINAVTDALKNYSANPGRSGYEISIKTAEKIYKVREKVAKFFNASDPQNVVFTLNCTHSINYVLKGVLQYGDHIVISSLEHNAVLRPLTKMKSNFTIANVSHTDDNVTFENFKKSIKPNTKMIFCTGASNVTGKILPLEKIGKLCREKGILFGVDAAQLAGVMNIDVKKMNIDFLCVAPHKGLYAPMGVGILVCEKKIPNTIIEGGTGTNSLQTVQPIEMPERLESGTINVPAIFGIGAAIDYINGLGIEKIYNHEMEIIGYIYEKLKKNKNITLHTPFPEKNSFVAVIPFNINGLRSEEAAEFLNTNGVAVRAGYHCAPFAHKQLGTLETGAVRVSVSAFNSKNQAEKLLSLLNNKKT